MASSSALEALFLRARDHELTARRWAAAAVVALLAFHVAFVTPFLAAAERRQAAASGYRHLEHVAAGLAELEARIGGPGAAVDEVMLPALDRLVEDIAGDLPRLAATRRSLAALVAARADAGTSARGPAAEGDEPAGAEPFQVENVKRIIAIGEAATRDELLAALAPLAEERIIHPRFAALQELWTSAVVPRIEADLDAVAGRVPELRSRFGAGAGDDDGDALWRALAEALAAERRAVRDLAWEPPERAYWWASSGDATAGEGVAFALEEAVAEQLRRPLALDQLRVSAERTAAAYRQLTEEVERRRAALTEEIERGGATFPGGFAAARIVRLFPLVLGLVLAALVTLAARRRRELGLLLHLLIEGGKGRGLSEWYFLRPRWGLGIGPPGRGRADTWRAAWLRILAPAAAALAWIGLAAVQLRVVEPPESLWTLTASGALAFLLAVVYDLVVARSLHRLLAEWAGLPAAGVPAAGVPAAGAPAVGGGDVAEQEEEGDLLDGHALRR